MTDNSISLTISINIKWKVKNQNIVLFFFSSRRRHTRLQGDWSSDVYSSDLLVVRHVFAGLARRQKAAARDRFGAGAAADGQVDVLLAQQRLRTHLGVAVRVDGYGTRDRKSTRLNSSHLVISYAVFCLKKKKK